MSLPLSPRRRPRRDTVRLLAGLAALSALAVFATALFWPRHDARTAHPVGIPGKPPFDAASLNANDIDTVNPDALFWEMFLRQARQPTVHTRRETFTNPRQAASRNLFSIHDDSIDHHTHRYVGTHVENWRGALKIVDRCANSARHSRDTYDTRWEPDGYSSMCRMRPFLGDGILPSGLTMDEAGRMISMISLQYQDFLHAGKPSFVDIGGKHYVRLPVHAQPLNINGRYWGKQILTWAFQETGLDSDNHGYTPGNPSSGADIVYYLDPSTLLPAYTYRHDIPPPPRPGRPPKPGQALVNRVEYVRPAHVPSDPLADTTPHQLSWPPDAH